MGYVPASRNAHEHRLYLQNMQTTFNQSDCKMSSSTKRCLDYCNQQEYEASEEERAQFLTGTR